MIKITVDKFDGIINTLIMIVGKRIYRNTDLNVNIILLYKNKLRDKNKIKLYFASSEGWKEKYPTLIQRFEFKASLFEDAIKRYNNKKPEKNNKMVDKFVKYL